MNNFKVNLFIVGAAKCGTTFLSEYLGRHSDCCVAKIKEPDFFSHDLLKKRGLYYNTSPVTEDQEYHRLFKYKSLRKYYIDASVSYLPYSEVAERIYRYNPKARIIILLRDPVDRAYSHYKMDKRLGLIKEPFSTLIKGDVSGSSLQFHRQQYLQLGLYHHQVAAYLKIFGEKQVYCHNHNSEMEAVIRGVSDFLEIPLQGFSGEKVNEAFIFKYSTLNKMYARKFIRKALKPIIPRKYLSLVKGKEPQVDSETREWLENYYREDQKLLKSQLNGE